MKRQHTDLTCPAGQCDMLSPCVSSGLVRGNAPVCRDHGCQKANYRMQAQQQAGKPEERRER